MGLTSTEVHVEKRENTIVNRLNKTKVERQVDHEQERVDRMKKESAIRRAEAAAKASILGICVNICVNPIAEESGCRARQAARGRESGQVL